MGITKKQIIATLTLLLAVIAFLSIEAQVVVDLEKVPKRPGFYVDLASFYDPPSKKTRLEVYYKIQNDQLTFIKTDQDYQASYELRVLVLKKGRQVTGASREEKYPVSSYQETISPSDFIINQLSLEVAPGKYEAQVTLIDTKVQKGFSLNLPFSIPDYSTKEMAISDLEFAQEVTATVAGSQFNKADLRVVPKVNQHLQPGLDSLRFYLEVYSNKAQPVEIELVTLNQWEKRMSKSSEMLNPQKGLLALVRSIPVRDLPPGRYTLRATILGSSQTVLAETKQDFLLEWTIDYYVRHDFKEAIDFLRYLATGEEIKTLKRTPPDKQVQAWQDFWKSKDPTPETPENEVQEEYYRRMRFANDNYSTWSRPGWKSDFGLVYIKYGEPDEIDRHPYDQASKSYEVWYYYQLRKVFTFLDDGYGEYRLLYPYDGDIYHNR
jgi:GWxTD domain-containing protein